MSRSRWTVVAVVAACLLVSFLFGPTLGFQFARVEGQAMAPTLNNQDRVVVNTWAYTFVRPGRGDVVMLRYPRDPRKFFVKRVIAAGGDTVRIDDGRVFVNDVAVDDRHVADNARSHDTYGPLEIAAGHYFVLGDRRNNSADSRHWGLVPEGHILGRVAVRWYPSLDRPR